MIYTAWIKSAEPVPAYPGKLNHAAIYKRVGTMGYWCRRTRSCTRSNSGVIAIASSGAATNAIAAHSTNACHTHIQRSRVSVSGARARRLQEHVVAQAASPPYGTRANPAG